MELKKTTHSPRGTVILFHGLNNPPQLMQELGQCLLEMGFNIIIGSFTGHNGDEYRLKKILKEDWLSDVENAVRISKEEESLPRIYIGFSLGGLVGLAFAQHNPNVFSKVILLAPAIEFRPQAYIARLIMGLKDHLQIISLASRKYNLYRWLPMQVYSVLFELRDELDEAKYDKINVPVLLMMHKYDEVVSFHRIKRMVAKYGLDWSVIGFSRPTKAFRHLVPIPSILGEKNLVLFQKEIKSFLEN